jgi:hypothetical protein
MRVHTFNRPMGIHLLHFAHGNECTRTHDEVCDIFATVAHDVDFHVGWEQLHALLLNTFNFFCQWVNIVLTKDDIHTLANVVIVNPTQANLFPWFYVK